MVTNSESTTWKLKASVPTTAIITSGIHRSGTRAGRSGARRGPGPWPASATGGGRSSAVLHHRRAPTITAMYERPSSVKHQP